MQPRALGEEHSALCSCGAARILGTSWEMSYRADMLCVHPHFISIVMNGKQVNVTIFLSLAGASALLLGLYQTELKLQRSAMTCVDCGRLLLHVCAICKFAGLRLLSSRLVKLANQRLSLCRSLIRPPAGLKPSRPMRSSRILRKASM